MTTSLELGCDCLGEITYVDAVLTDSRGEPYTITNAICLHEEDDGVLWKHVDEKAGAEVRRSRRMVVSFHATVANYEYLDLLALLPGRHHRVRGPRHRDHGHQLVRRRAPADGHRGGRPDLRAVPPALHRRPPGHGDRRSGEHRRGLRERGGADLRHQPLRPGAGAAQPRRWRPSPRAGRTTTGPPARLEGGQPGPAQPPGDADRLQAGRLGVVPGAGGPRARRSWRGPGSSTTPCGSRRTRRRSAGRRASSATRAAAPRGYRRGRRPTARSPTPTSCCGTSSASTTSRGPRTGRSCRWTRSRSR